MRLWIPLLLVLAVSGCGNGRPETVSGYVEGEYVYVSAPEGGWVTELSVKRGDNVKTTDALFALDAEAQSAARDQAAALLAQTTSLLSNVKKGRRPEEIDALKAEVAKSRSNLDLARSELKRAQDLKEKGFVSQAFLDARSASAKSAQTFVNQADANLKLAQQGARSDEIKAAEAQVAQAQAALAKAEYALDQRRIKSKVSGRVEDILRRKGEFVPPGGAIVQLLPPRSVKIRFFVPELARARVKVGNDVKVSCDGCGRELKAKIVFLSSTAEYTPPVIYSIGSREKLVWMVEAEPARDVYLSPGQPVDVALP